MDLILAIISAQAIRPYFGIFSMINSFKTLFEARELKFQQERLFRGECVDLEARITTDGVMDALSGYEISGVYQPTDELSGPFYPLDAEIVNGKAVLHWKNTNDFGKNAYNVWGLLTKDEESSYPICWRLSFQHSPSFPLSSVDPIPRAIDFSQYDLINAPWLPISALDEIKDDIVLSALEQVDGRYLPLSGGVLSGTIEATNFVAEAGRGVNVGNYNEIEDNGIAVGVNSKAYHGSIAIGNGVEAESGWGNINIGLGSYSTGSNGIGIGQSAEAASFGVVVGMHSKASSPGAVAIGTGAYATANNAIQLGSNVIDDSTWNSQYNTTPHSLRVLDKMVLSGDNLTLDRERVPYLSDYVKTDELTAYAQLSDLENIDIDGMSACLSSNEFADEAYLSVDPFGDPDMNLVSMQDFGKKLNDILMLLKRESSIPTTRNDLYCYAKYDDGSIWYHHQGVGIYSGTIPNKPSVVKVLIQKTKDNPSNQFWLANDSFNGCVQLTELSIPKIVTDIGLSAFTDCPAVLTFEERTMAEVQAIGNYPWNIPTGQGRIICTDGTL